MRLLKRNLFLLCMQKSFHIQRPESVLKYINTDRKRRFIRASVDLAVKPSIFLYPFALSNTHTHAHTHAHTHTQSLSLSFSFLYQVSVIEGPFIALISFLCSKFIFNYSFSFRSRKSRLRFFPFLKKASVIIFSRVSTFLNIPVN